MADPSGTLASDEVQILARDAIFPLPNGTMSHFVMGDVLVCCFELCAMNWLLISCKACQASMQTSNRYTKGFFVKYLRR